MNLENLYEIVMENLGVALSVVALAGFLGAGKYFEHRTEENLSPNSFYAGSEQFESQYGKAFLQNKDLGNDGKYETVIRYVGKDGKYHELEMRLDEDGLPEVVKK
ncbi:MAG: hypothetical protein AABX93_01660 [Nanoarchaeota archaeon]